MFNKKANSEAFFAELESNLNKQQVRPQKEKQAKTKRALDNVVTAANLLDEVGLEKQANLVTKVLHKLAWHVPTSDSATSGLTSEKMQKNLAEKGWVFNADDGQVLDVATVSSGEKPELKEDGTIEVGEEMPKPETQEEEKETDEAEPAVKEASSLTMSGCMRFIINKIIDNPGEWHQIEDLISEYGLDPTGNRAAISSKLRGKLGRELGIESYMGRPGSSFQAFRVKPVTQSPETAIDELVSE